MSQNIKYETTSIEPTQSAMELSALVQKYGGTRFELRWDSGLLMGVRFAVRHDTLGEVPVRLPARVDEVLRIFRERKPYSHRMRRTRAQWEAETSAQAYRIAWRHLRDFCEQVLMAVDLGVIELQEGFMWAMEIEDPETGQVGTMGEIVSHYMRAIGTGGALRLTPGAVREADYTVEGP